MEFNFLNDNLFIFIFYITLYVYYKLNYVPKYLKNDCFYDYFYL